MAIPTLDSVLDEMDATCIAILGDPISYAINGGAAASIMAYVDHSDKTEALVGGELTAQDIWIEVLKTDVPTPSDADRVTLPQRPGITLAPRDWKTNRDGRMWHIYLKRVR